MATRRTNVVGALLLYAAAFLLIFVGMVLLAGGAIISAIQEYAAIEEPVFLIGVIVALVGAYLLRLGLRHDEPASG
jgi:hypothetical protein